MPQAVVFVKSAQAWYNRCVIQVICMGENVAVIQRKTQAPSFWSDEFTVTPDDFQYLNTLLIEEEVPLSAEELGRALVLHRCRQEEALIEQALSRGTLYQPDRSYEVGETIVFPVLGYRVGRVVGMRPGHNPEYEPFEVIEVDFEDGDRREFVAALAGDHPLNREIQAGEGVDAVPRSPEEMAALYGALVGEMLEPQLEANPHFVCLAGKWFRRDLLVEVHVGHLNLAEAVLDVAGGGPLPTEALLGDLELPEEVAPQLRVFSLNYALQEDERFDEVGPAGQVLWYLRRLEPEGVQATPLHLRYRPVEYEAALLTSEMLALERELDDEWSSLDSAGEVAEPVTVVLTHPHWRSGTLPLSSRLAQVFPTGRTQRIFFTLVDGDTGDEMPAWVVREARYVYGLKEWYGRYRVPVGAYLELSRDQEQGKVVIRRRGRRPRREWVRVALPVDGRLTFEMRRTLISCEYDELMIVEEEDPAALDRVWERVRAGGLSVEQLVAEVFPELAKLSPQGTVHAATLYSAINVAMRVPPGPILAGLASSGLYAPMGDNYWVVRATSGGI